MNIKYPLTIISRPGNLWYVGFEIGEIIRLLPRKKRFFRKWKPQNCPIAGISQREEVFYFENCYENTLTQGEILEVFVSMYHTVEDYLFRINCREVFENLYYREALWTFRNIHKQCGNCGNSFNKIIRNMGNGMCNYCLSSSLQNQNNPNA